MRAILNALLIAMNVITCQGRSNCTTGITRSRLNPNLVETSITQDLSVGHAIQGASSGQAEITKPGFMRNKMRHSQHNFFQNSLYGRSDIHMELGKGFFWLARWALE